MTSNGVPNKRVLVIGAGPCGLTTIKQCIDEGLEVLCVEQSDQCGGLWYYKDQGASVARGTISNTSKEFSAFSDFPPPKEFPNYMHNTQYLKYFRMYATHFNLEQHIRYNTRVLAIEMDINHAQTGKWSVRFQHVLNPDDQYREQFDAVAIATGHHHKPLMPSWPGQEQFKGKISHSHSFKSAEGYDGKRVVVVGSGNSGCDTAVELAAVADQVYLCSRRGVWVRRRNGFRGRPLDVAMASRAMWTLQSLLPQAIVDGAYEWVMNLPFDHELYGLKPKHRFSTQHPTINDALPNFISAGKIKTRRNIERFTEEGVIFEGTEGQEIIVDEVILATGYLLDIPFVDPSIISVLNNELDLFMGMFNPKLPHPKSICLIAAMQPLGPLHTTAEMQARWFAALNADRVKWPGQSEIEQKLEQHRQFRNSLYKTVRHGLEVNYMPYVQQLAEWLGVAPNLTYYALADPKLWYRLIFGVFSTYQFRLQGRHRWSGAREAILGVSERIDAPFKVTS